MLSVRVKSIFLQNIILKNQIFRYVLGTLVKAVELEEEKRLREQCQTLLKVAKNLFSHLGKDRLEAFVFCIFLK